MFDLLKSRKKLASLVILFLIVMIVRVYGQVTFKNVQPEIGEAFADWPNTAAWGDIDNDGDLDVYMSIGSRQGNDLMINDLSASGKFNRADTLMAHYVKTRRPRQVLMGDVDNDWDLDLMAIADEKKISLMINKLAETDSLWFEDVSEQTGIAHLDEKYYAASMADYNNDGLLDIFISGLSEEALMPSLLFKNTTPVGGSLSFEELAESAGIFSLDGWGMATGSWGDYDNDGDQDIFIATMPTWPVLLFRNESDGTFTEVAIETGFADSFGNSRAAIWGDYDNDGDLDIYISRATYTDLPDMDTCELWRNDDGYFNLVEAARVVQRTIRGAAWGDYDNDGDLDLHLSEDGKPDIMFRNDGNDTFVDVAETVGLIQVEDPNGGGMLDIQDRGGQTWADWDADGDLDLLLPSEMGLQPYLMQNDGGNANNWLEVKLIGIQSNRYGVGTRIIALSGELKQIREVHIGSGYLCGPPTDVHFGFQQRSTIDSLIVRWPSGPIDALTDVAVKQMLSIEEGSTISSVGQKNKTVLKGFALMQNYPNPFNPETRITYEIMQTGQVQLNVFTITGQHVATLVDGMQTNGRYSVLFDVNSLPSGMYFYRLSAGGFVAQHKMILLR